jgi:predicted thioesterase
MSINIPESDSISYNEFIKGNPVTVRIEASGNEEKYMKGTKVKVRHLTMEATGEIVSEPIVINQNEGKKTLSIIIEKKVLTEPSF